MDDTETYADLVLPVNTAFESWGYGDTVQGTNITSLLVFRQPVVKPVYDTLQAGDVFIRLVKQMKGSIGDAMPWKDNHQALLSRLNGIAEANEGMITAGSYEKDWLRSLARLGWRPLGFRSAEEFQQQLSEKGGWWSPLYEFGI